MRVFKWNAAQAVFLPEIDAEHRAIYQAAGELQRAVEGSAPGERTLEILQALVSAVEDHFAHEERMMAAANYLSFDWHRQQHDTARKRLKEVEEQVAAGDTGAVADLLQFLSTWFRDHVAVADRIVGAYLRNYGRSHAGFAASVS
jgi:hemerythrin